MGKILKYFFLSILALIICLVLYISYFEIGAYFISKQIIVWSKNEKIKPSDFKMEANENSSLKLSDYYGLYTKSTLLSDIEVKAVFHKNKSWIKDTTDFEKEMKVSKLVFDLYEIYARKCNDSIQKIDYYNNPDISYSNVINLVNNMHKELLIVVDTVRKPNMNYSIWRNKIDSLLKAKK